MSIAFSIVNPDRHDHDHNNTFVPLTNQYKLQCIGCDENAECRTNQMRRQKCDELALQMLLKTMNGLNPQMHLRNLFQV